MELVELRSEIAEVKEQIKGTMDLAERTVMRNLLLTLEQRVNLLMQSRWAYMRNFWVCRLDLAMNPRPCKLPHAVSMANTLLNRYSKSLPCTLACRKIIYLEFTSFCTSHCPSLLIVHAHMRHVLIQSVSGKTCIPSYLTHSCCVHFPFCFIGNAPLPVQDLRGEMQWFW